MDVSRLLDGLNDAQREAVTAESGSTLVLAGAGSGKTRVLVHRVAWLVEVERLSPWEILAVTFTNKAAREMRQRIEQLLGQPVGAMWVGTFHGLAHRLLRSHWEEAGLPKGFQILDADDQHRLVKRVVRERGLDEAKWPPRQLQWYINQQKDEGLRATALEHGGDLYQKQMIELYAAYQAACERAGVVDFAELLLRAYELWRNRPDVLQHYQARFAHILVDEFQDTNHIQYAWLKLLAGGRDNLFVVGDDDQSIYGWRGARVENILDFPQATPNTRMVRLEQNYRSTGNILGAANAVIANNPERLGKELWTADGEGEPVRLYSAFNEIDEARFVVGRIREAVETGSARSGIAILYRTTAQSRVYEEALLQAAIPYRVYGGLRFFERAEIKDALAYLRLVGNPDDDTAFERAINQPPRGIGAKTVETIREHARTQGCSLWRAAVQLSQSGGLSARARGAIEGFFRLIAAQAEAIAPLENLGAQVEQVLKASGLPEHFAQSRDGKGQDRIENLQELANAAREFAYEDEDDVLTDLEAFLAHAALEAGEGQADEWEDCVQLMTLHAAKGLEFPMVFLVGLEEGLFPHSMSADDPQRLAEERRLCYVGMTRARQHLTLCHAESRRLRGQETYPMPSRFLREIPPALLQEVRAQPRITRPAAGVVTAGVATAASGGGGFGLGQRVSHPKFGPGVVLNAEGRGAAARVQVNFEQVGPKWLVLAYANLEAV